MNLFPNPFYSFLCGAICGEGLHDFLVVLEPWPGGIPLVKDEGFRYRVKLNGDFVDDLVNNSSGAVAVRGDLHAKKRNILAAVAAALERYRVCVPPVSEATCPAFPTLKVRAFLP